MRVDSNTLFLLRQAADQVQAENKSCSDSSSVSPVAPKRRRITKATTASPSRQSMSTTTSQSSKPKRKKKAVAGSHSACQPARRRRKASLSAADRKKIKQCLQQKINKTVSGQALNQHYLKLCASYDKLPKEWLLSYKQLYTSLQAQNSSKAKTELNGIYASAVQGLPNQNNDFKKIMLCYKKHQQSREQGMEKPFLIWFKDQVVENGLLTKGMKVFLVCIETFPPPRPAPSISASAVTIAPVPSPKPDQNQQRDANAVSSDSVVPETVQRVC